MSDRDRDNENELIVCLHKAASLTNILIEHSFSAGDVKALERKGLDDGSLDVALILSELIGEAQELAAKIFDAPAPEPLSTA